MQTYITNARIVLPDRVIPSGTVVVRGTQIAAIGKAEAAPRGVKKINARGDFVSPGFIDLHIHGDIKLIAQQQARGGTTGFLATLHPARPKTLLKNIAGVRKVWGQRQAVRGARPLGLRLEGPFLHAEFCGALPPRYLRLPELQELKKIIRQAQGCLKMMVLAPELKAAAAAIRLLRKYNIIVSLGHTAATYEQAERGIDAGITHATHTFNRMHGFDPRQPGATGAVLTDSRVACEVIADGVHVHPAAVRLLAACKGLDQVMLVTDSTQAQGRTDKRRAGGVFRLKDGRLYGTALTLNRAMKNAVRFLGLSIPEAVRLVTINPARVLNINKTKGSIAVGKDADLVILDKGFNVKMTMVEGKTVYKKRSEDKCAG